MGLSWGSQIVRGDFPWTRARVNRSRRMWANLPSSTAAQSRRCTPRTWHAWCRGAHRTIRMRSPHWSGEPVARGFTTNRSYVRISGWWALTIPSNPLVIAFKVLLTHAGATYCIIYSSIHTSVRAEVPFVASVRRGEASSRDLFDFPMSPPRTLRHQDKPLVILFLFLFSLFFCSFFLFLILRNAAPRHCGETSRSEAIFLDSSDF